MLARPLYLRHPNRLTRAVFAGTRRHQKKCRSMEERSAGIWKRVTKRSVFTHRIVATSNKMHCTRQRQVIRGMDAQHALAADAASRRARSVLFSRLVSATMSLPSIGGAAKAQPVGLPFISGVLKQQHLSISAFLLYLDFCRKERKVRARLTDA